MKDNNGSDPTPFLQSDWMSSEVSELESGDEEQKAEHKMTLMDKAGLTLEDVSNRVPVWEVVKPAWRSVMVSLQII
jgi:hypothetical protein